MLCCALKMPTDRKEIHDYEMDILPCYAVRTCDEMSIKEIGCCKCTIVTAPVVYKTKNGRSLTKDNRQPGRYDIVCVSDARKGLKKQKMQTQPMLNATLMPLDG
jgi:hypothetical protein